MNFDTNLIGFHLIAIMRWFLGCVFSRHSLYQQHICMHAIVHFIRHSNVEHETSNRHKSALKFIFMRPIIAFIRVKWFVYTHKMGPHSLTARVDKSTMPRHTERWNYYYPKLYCHLIWEAEHKNREHHAISGRARKTEGVNYIFHEMNNFVGKLLLCLRWCGCRRRRWNFADFHFIV